MGRFFRRFFRLAFPAAAGCSAVALVACLILWPLSYRWEMTLRYATSGGTVNLLGVRGGRLWVQHVLVFVTRARPRFSCEFAPLDPTITDDWSYTDWKHQELGLVRIGTRDYALGAVWFRSANLSYLAVPLLYPTLLSAILPAFWLRGFLRRRRQARLARRGFPVEPSARAR